MKDLKLGQSKRLKRQFTRPEIADYAKLVQANRDGVEHRNDAVPEPLIGALWSCLLGMHLPGLGTMYLKQKSRWHRTVSVGEEITATVTITRLRPEKHLVDLETRCTSSSGELLASGEALVYVRDLAT